MAEVVTGKVTVKGKNLDVTPALRNYAEKKVQRLGKYLGNDGFAAEVILILQRELQCAEVTLLVGGLILRGEGRTQDMYASIDMATEKIEQQIRKFKTRIENRIKGPSIVDLAVDEGAKPARPRGGPEEDDLRTSAGPHGELRTERETARRDLARDGVVPADTDGREVAEAERPQVVRVKRFAFKPMDVEEAILQMELLGHSFFVFVNARTEQVNVVYRRRDGTYGVIEPDV